VIGAALALMELGFTYPWSLLVGFWIEGEPRPVLSAWSILGLVGGAHLVASRLAGSGLPPRLARSVAVALGLALALAAASFEHGPPTPDLTPTTLAFLLGVHLWRRGLLHAQPPTGREAVERSLGAGTLSLAACLVLAAAAGARSLAVLQEGAAAYVVGFYGVGLSALAFARLREVRRQAGGEAGGEGTRGWLGFVGATVIGLLVVAVLGGQALSFDLAAAVLRPIAWALSTVLFIIFLVLGLPLMIALEVLLGWLRQYLGALPSLRMDPLGNSDLDELRRRGPGQPPPEELLLIMQWLTVGLVVALAALLIARALLWRAAARRDEEVPEDRDSVWSWALVVDAVRAWLAGLRRRLAGRPATPARAAARGAGAEPAVATTVRQLYREVLALAAQRGAPRPPAATPYEQLPRLQSALGPDEALAEVTRAYVRVRYGEHRPADAELDALRGEWDRLRQAPARPPRE
jgi:hypothetical protein